MFVSSNTLLQRHLNSWKEVGEAWKCRHKTCNEICNDGALGISHVQRRVLCFLFLRCSSHRRVFIHQMTKRIIIVNTTSLLKGARSYGEDHHGCLLQHRSAWIHAQNELGCAQQMGGYCLRLVGLCDPHWAHQKNLAYCRPKLFLKCCHIGRNCVPFQNHGAENAARVLHKS